MHNSKANQRTKVQWALILACSAASTPRAAHATDFQWQGGAATNDWDLPANWIENAAPPPNGAADLIFDTLFHGTAFVFPNLDQNYSINSIYFNSAFAYTLTAPSGVSLTLGAGGLEDVSMTQVTFQVPLILGASQEWSLANITAPINIPDGLNTNGNTLSFNDDGLNVINGPITGAGGLTVAGGLQLSQPSTYTGDTNLNAGNLVLASGGGLSGTNVNVNSASEWDINAGATANSTDISLTSGGVMDITGGTVITLNLAIGGGSALTLSSGSINGSGGGTLQLGDSTTPATATMTSGTLVMTTVLTGAAKNSVSAISQSGGISTIRSLTLSASTGSKSSYTLSGIGIINATNEIVGNAGSATFIQTGGADMVANPLQLALFSGSDGTFILSGGTLVIPSITGGAGKSVFDFNGGALSPTLAAATLFQSLTTVAVQSGGAIIDTGANNVTLGLAMVHDPTAGAPQPDGGFTKMGAATILLTGSNTYTGPTVVSAGTVTLNPGVSLNNSPIIVTPSGTFTLAGGTVNDPTQSVQLNSTGGGLSTFTLTSGALTTNVTEIGSGGAGTSTFIQTGGTHTTPGVALNVGNSGNATYTLSGAGVLNTQETDVGYFGPAQFTQSSGTQFINGPLNLGLNTSANGAYTLTGGQLTTQQTIVGAGGAGTFIQSNGTHTATAGLIVANSAASTGTYDLNGGTLAAPSVSGGAGASVFNFNGGTLQATANNTAFLSGLTTMNVQSGGAIINTHGFNETISRPLTHDSTPGAPAIDGGLSKLGGGTLTLKGTNTYTGPTSVPSGELIFTASTAQLTGPFSLGNTPGLAGITLANGIGPLTITGLSVGTNARLDIGNNKIRVNYGIPANDPVTAIAAALLSGYDSGLWDGMGITSSTAATNPSQFAVGYLDGNRANDKALNTVSPDQIVIGYTLAGDAFLQNTVGFDDLVIVAQNFGFTGNDWAGGNFVYDPTGSVGFPDLVKVAQNFGFSSGISQGAPGGGLSAVWQSGGGQISVPEPAALTWTIGAALALTARRRRRQSGLFFRHEFFVSA